ncbi:MAG: hypothetical protein LBR74_07545 [Eubacterium sp.]|jgi:hypothetical protein|nr:hypothetical protein [Eubacterium sp.]
MEFTYHEKNALCDIFKSASGSLFNAMKYIYAITEDHYYNINVKDIFKIALNDITNVNILENIGVALTEKGLGELASHQFNVVEGLIYYSFLTRLPFFRRSINDCPLKEAQLRELYNHGLKNGAENFGNIITYDFRIMSKLIKNKQNEPEFNGDWFRRWVYTFGNDLAVINNRNIFLLGSVEALFPLYYAALIEKISAQLEQWKKKT